MMKTYWSSALAGALLLGSAACGDTVTVNDTEKGGLGESCRARNDCEGDLVCRDNVCSMGAGGGEDDGGAPVNTQVRGGKGESCQSRADCEAELACIDNVCVPEAEGDAGMSEPAATRGKRGESCEATGDCEAGLVCIGRRCREADIQVDFATKSCDRLECRADADCCEGYTPFYPQSTCDQWKSDCDASPGSSSCSSYSNYCVCAQECIEQACVSYDYCVGDAECFSGACVDNHCTECDADADCGVFVCVDNECVECRADADCDGADESCIDNVCDSGCTRDEQCGLFEKCMDRECVEVGCETNRQCYFVTGDERSTCTDDGCVTPCENDAECTDSFHVCQEGVCRFVGCESDQECRAYFAAEGISLYGYEAVCREPTP